MKIFIDIETIPDQSPNALDQFMTGEVKCPHKSKADIGKDLGMAPDEYKFIGAEDFKQLWIEKKGKEALKTQAEQKWLKTSLDGSYGQIICIGYAINSGPIQSIHVDESHDEKWLLTQFWQDVEDQTMSKPRRFIAHNAKFDLPFLFHRSVINSVRPGNRFDPWARQGEKRYCTMEAWAGYGNMIGLDRLAKALGVQGKAEDMTGSDVWPEYQKGNIEKIARYCREDVRVLIDVYNRLNFL